MLDQSGPLTLGQLSVWRDIENLPFTRAHEANVSGMWTAPAGIPPTSLEKAVRTLHNRHETLQVRYDPDGAGPTRQILDKGLDVPITWISAPAAAEQIHTEELSRAFDLCRELSWRAAIVPGPHRFDVVITMHHIACDAFSINRLKAEFTALVSGRPAAMQPSPSLIGLALRQQDDWSGAQGRKTREYFERVLSAEHTARAHGPAAEEGDTIQGELISEKIRQSATAIAEQSRISLTSVLLASGVRAVSRNLGRDTFAVDLMSSNRFSAAARNTVTSMNQWVPLLVEGCADGPLSQYAADIHRKCFLTYRYGVYSVDDIDALWRHISGSAARRSSPVAFNYVPEAAWRPAREFEDTVIVERPFRSLYLQPCYIKVFDLGTALWLKVTSRLPGGAATAAAILEDMRSQLLADAV